MISQTPLDMHIENLLAFATKVGQDLRGVCDAPSLSRIYRRSLEVVQGIILTPESWARSALLKVPRPVDKVIHSIIVATEIVMFSERFLGHPATPLVHPPTPKILTQIAAPLQSVQDMIDSHARLGLTPITARVSALLQGVRDVLALDGFAKQIAAPHDSK